MGCKFGKHNWQVSYSNEIFSKRCIKCGKLSTGVKTYRRRNKKLRGTIISIICAVIVIFFVVYLPSIYPNLSIPNESSQIPLPKFSELPQIKLPISVPISVANLTTIVSKPQQLLQEITQPQQTSVEESQQAIDYINTIRANNSESPIAFDQRAYNLGLARAKDMYDYGYLDHVNPTTGTCPYSIKSQFGFADNEYVAENALGYETKQEMGLSNGDFHQNIDSWMGDIGHKMNLLYYGHYGGAYACYGSQCVFEGVNHDQLGLGCHTAAEGKASWSKMATCTDDQLRQYQTLEQQLDAMKPELQNMPNVATSQAQYEYYNGLVNQYNSIVNQINNFTCS